MPQNPRFKFLCKSNEFNVTFSSSFFCLAKAKKISWVPFLIFCQFRCSAVHYIYLFRIINTTERTGGLAKSHRAVRGAFCGCTDRFTTQMFINRGKVNEAWHGINQQTLMSENWSRIIILMGCLLYLSICTHLLFSLHCLPLPRRAFNFLHCCSSPLLLLCSDPLHRPPPRDTAKGQGVNMVIGGGDW